MNGESKGTSGVVDLGTVITAHQDISGKADKSDTVTNVAYDSVNKKLTKTINGTTSDVVTTATLKSDMNLATIATSGSYNDATDKPTLNGTTLQGAVTIDIPTPSSFYTQTDGGLGYTEPGGSPVVHQINAKYLDLSGKVDKNADITGGTHTKITYDSKGLVTAGADLAASDIPSIPLSKISDVTATSTELNYVHGVTSSIQTQLNNKEAADATILKKANVVDGVSSTSTDLPLSAKQGKLLNDRITSLEAVGRFLSVWNCTTGLPTSEPTTIPYVYKSGDYYRVGVVGSTNYRPSGQSYNRTASTTLATENVQIGDVYYYDGNAWTWQAGSGGGTVQDVQVNSVSILTSGIANITENNLPNIHVAKISDLTATATELNYTDGVTSNIQTQLDGKQATISDLATIRSGAAAGATALQPNSVTGTNCKITYSNGQVTGGAGLAESDIPTLHLSKITDVTATATELNYVDGVTSPIQTQLDNKVTKNADISGATKTKITYDAKGLVTGGADLAASDIPSIPLSKISDVTASATELNYTDGVTSNIQTQLNSKDEVFTAVYGETSFADIVAAYNAGKTVRVDDSYNDYLYLYYIRTDPEDGAAYFTGIDYNLECVCLTCYHYSDEDYWEWTQDSWKYIEANPTGAATSTLNKLQVSGTIYSIPSGPSAYLKDASASGNTLTLTKQDDSTVTFTPTETHLGTVTSVGAGAGLNISGTATVNPTVNVASTHKLPTTSEWDGKQSTLTVNPATTTATLTGLGINGTNYSISGGSGPATYLKNASVSNKTLTLTKQDDSTVTFTDTGVEKYVATYDTTSFADISTAYTAGKLIYCSYQG